jgi:hypothetical protein
MQPILERRVRESVRADVVFMLRDIEKTGNSRSKGPQVGKVVIHF